MPGIVMSVIMTSNREGSWVKRRRAFLGSATVVATYPSLLNMRSATLHKMISSSTKSTRSPCPLRILSSALGMAHAIRSSAGR